MLFRKSHCLPMLLAVVLMLCTGSALAKIERFNPSYRKAEKLYKAKNYEKAEKLYKKSLTQCKTTDMDCRIKTLSGLKKLYIETKQFEQALQIQNQFFEDYEHGKAIFYNMQNLLSERAELYAKQRHWDLAAQDYQEAMRLDEQEFGLLSYGKVKSLEKLAEVYEQQGKKETAAEIKKYREEVKAKQRSCPKEPDFSTFIAKLQRQIRLQWSPPRVRADHQIIAVFRQFPNGSIAQLRLTKPSKNLAANQSALVAIERAAPFSGFPASCLDYVDVEFIFDYEVHYR